MDQDIAECYLSRTRPNVLFGGKSLPESAALTVGYTVVTDRDGLGQLDTEAVTHVAGLFGEGHMPYEYDYFAGQDLKYDSLPHLSEMARVALRILDHNKQGFFLMIEGGLSVVSGNGLGAFPTVIWSTGDHTPVNVPAYAWGVGAGRVAAVLDNTQWFAIEVGLDHLPTPWLISTMRAVVSFQPSWP